MQIQINKHRIVDLQFSCVKLSGKFSQPGAHFSAKPCRPPFRGDAACVVDYDTRYTPFRPQHSVITHPIFVALNYGARTGGRQKKRPTSAPTANVVVVAFRLDGRLDGRQASSMNDIHGLSLRPPPCHTLILRHQEHPMPACPPVVTSSMAAPRLVVARCVKWLCESGSGGGDGRPRGFRQTFGYMTLTAAEARPVVSISGKAAISYHSYHPRPPLHPT